MPSHANLSADARTLVADEPLFAPVWILRAAPLFALVFLALGESVFKSGTTLHGMCMGALSAALIVLAACGWQGRFEWRR